MASIGQHCRFENGDRGKNYPGRKAFVTEGVPFVNAGHIEDGQLDLSEMNYIPRHHFERLGSGKIRRGDLLFCLRGSLGKYAIVDNMDEGAIASSLVIVRPDKALAPQFLAHYFGSSMCAEEIVKYGNGAAQPNLSAKSLASFQLPVPPLEEQHRIVAVLDEAFEGLARARAHTEANLKNARVLFTLELKDMFSEGKDGWTKAKIEDLCTIRSGTTVSKALERASGDVPYIKVADMNLADNLEGIVTSTRFLSANDVPDRQIIRAGATIFPKRGGAILTNKKRKVLVDICADLNVMGVIPGAKIDEDFLHYYFLSIDMREIGSGSSIPQINNYDINPMVLSFPSSHSQQAEVAHGLQLLRDKTATLSAAYRTKLSDIEALRQSLLQKAFAGELT